MAERGRACHYVQPNCRADYNAGRDRGDGRLTDFIGHFVLALLLVVLLRVLYAVCALLVRTRDGGNIAFAAQAASGNARYRSASTGGDRSLIRC